MRSGAKAIEDDTEKRLAIPLTVRQLEAIIRIAESLAKMELVPFAVDRHIEEALRLFQVNFITKRTLTIKKLLSNNSITNIERILISRLKPHRFLHSKLPRPEVFPAQKASQPRKTRSC